MTSAPASSRPRSPRLAARALIMHRDRLLLVNAWPAHLSDLWCAPGGGAEAGQSLPDTLRREVHEETGLTVEVGDPALVNEFHDPASGFHQVDVYFRCGVRDASLPQGWIDPAGVVTKVHWFARCELELGHIRFKPDSLPRVAWGEGLFYDPLEVIVR